MVLSRSDLHHRVPLLLHASPDEELKHESKVRDDCSNESNPNESSVLIRLFSSSFSSSSSTQEEQRKFGIMLPHFFERQTERERNNEQKTMAETAKIANHTDCLMEIDEQFASFVIQKQISRYEGISSSSPPHLQLSASLSTTSSYVVSVSENSATPVGVEKNFVSAYGKEDGGNIRNKTSKANTIDPLSTSLLAFGSNTQTTGGNSTVYNLKGDFLVKLPLKTNKHDDKEITSPSSVLPRMPLLQLERNNSEKGATIGDWFAANLSLLAVSSSSSSNSDMSMTRLSFLLNDESPRVAPAQARNENNDIVDCGTKIDPISAPSSEQKDRPDTAVENTTEAKIEFSEETESLSAPKNPPTTRGGTGGENEGELTAEKGTPSPAITERTTKNVDSGDLSEGRITLDVETKHTGETLEAVSAKSKSLSPVETKNPTEKKQQEHVKEARKTERATDAKSSKASILRQRSTAVLSSKPVGHQQTSKDYEREAERIVKEQDERRHANKLRSVEESSSFFQNAMLSIVELTAKSVVGTAENVVGVCCLRGNGQIVGEEDEDEYYEGDEDHEKKE